MSNSIKDQYKAFCEWCYENPSFDLDPRIHQHSGPIEHGGYIADPKTATAFAAWKATLVQQSAPAVPVAFFWEDTDPRVEGRRYGPYFGWPTEEALARVGDSAKPIPLYAAPPTTAPDTVAVLRELLGRFVRTIERTANDTLDVRNIAFELRALLVEGEQK